MRRPTAPTSARFCGPILAFARMMPIVRQWHRLANVDLYSIVPNDRMSFSGRPSGDVSLALLIARLAEEIQTRCLDAGVRPEALGLCDFVRRPFAPPPMYRPWALLMTRR
jgi:hypothetical protein